MTVAAEQHLAHAGEGVCVASEESATVEGRCKIQAVLEADAAMRGAQAEQPAVAGRATHRATGIGAEREIHQGVGHRRGRARGRAAGDALRRAAIDRAPKWALMPFIEKASSSV